jgi:hypothetical protein
MRGPSYGGLFFTRGTGMAVGVFLALACGTFREDEFQCEEAIGHLMDCCSGFGPPPGYCSYEPGGTSGSGCDATTIPPTYPALSPDESRCIRSESCGELASSGVCVRATAAGPGEAYASGVCP